jgi:hypothetical protein
MRQHRHPVDASVEASGPHDFTVRIRAPRPSRTKASTAFHAKRS